MSSSTPAFAQLIAPAHWRTVEFISDLHLQATEPLTLKAWERYLAQTQADAVFILGDLFEVWVGDDVLHQPDTKPSSADQFENACCRTLRACADQRAVFLMHGNRDFLLGSAFAQACGLTLLADPTVLIFAGKNYLLSHGDALCLDDTDYLQFRSQVRQLSWQENFLAQPLPQRLAYARSLRQHSEARKALHLPYADVDGAAARQWLQQADAQTLIHGHTHKPADHELGGGLHRHVLSDWDGAAMPARAQVLRLTFLSPGNDAVPHGQAGHPSISLQRQPLL